MQEIKNTSNILKEVLTHVIGWPLFFVALVLCVIGGVTIGGIMMNYGLPPDTDNFRPFYDNASLISFVWSIFVLSFFCSLFFGIFIFTRGLSRVIFSLMISFSLALLILGYVHWRKVEYAYKEKSYYIKCVLGKNPGHNADCESMTEQKRKKMMIDNGITEKDLDTYKEKYIGK